MRLLFFIICIGLLPISNLQAQPKSILDKTIFVDYGERFHADAYVVPSGHRDSARIAVFFRMANDFLTFTKNDDLDDIGGNFIAPMAVGIEVRDTLGVIRQRHRWEGKAYTNNFDETNNKNKFHFGWVVFTVSGGSYDISLEILEQKESNEKRITIPTVSFIPNRPLRQLTAPLFVQPVSRDGKELLRPYVFSGNVAFGSEDALALVLLSDSEPVRYDYIVDQEPYSIRDIQWWTVSDIRGKVSSSTTRFPAMSTSATTSEPFLEIRTDVDNSLPIALVEIPIPVSTLVPGNYSIRLIKEGTDDTTSMKFRIVWEMMPLSLRNIDYAYSMLPYIVSADVVDSLDEGSDAERRLRLMDWWRKQDRTLTTTFNERMATFYQRADQAFFAFSTIQEPDGADTERGKIYILYGPPDEVNKALPIDNAPLEIWTYKNRVNQIFTFVINDDGKYKLMEIRPFEN